MPSARVPVPAFTGVYPILVTPFDEREELDLKSFERLIQAQVALGVDGVTILGVLGESNRLTDAEREALIATAVAAAAGRIPIIVGTSHTGTAGTLKLSQRAEALGASGVMVTPSREPVHNEQRIFEFFQRVGEGIGIPICLQDHPASTQVDMGVPLLLRMVAEIPRVACVKAEATPSPQKIAALRAGMEAGSGSGSKGRRVPILTGLGAVYGMFDLERGSDGFMTGFAFPEVLMAMTRAAKAGRAEEAWALYTRYLPLIVFEAQPGLAIRKEIYRLRGWIAHNRVRHPGATIDAATARQLGELLRRVVGEAEPARPVVPVR